MLANPLLTTCKPVAILHRVDAILRYHEIVQSVSCQQNEKMFLSFDKNIVNFYPSITKNLFDRFISWTKR